MEIPPGVGVTPMTAGTATGEVLPVSYTSASGTASDIPTAAVGGGVVQAGLCLGGACSGGCVGDGAGGPCAGCGLLGPGMGTQSDQFYGPNSTPRGGQGPGGLPVGLTGAGQYGLPITGTPIGLPGPPHVPLGVPAGLKRHVMHNWTSRKIPDPVSKLKINVKQRPGLSYPQPPNRAWVVEDTIHSATHYPKRNGLLRGLKNHLRNHLSKHAADCPPGAVHGHHGLFGGGHH